jgi:hypothetical protein
LAPQLYIKEDAFVSKTLKNIQTYGHVSKIIAQKRPNMTIPKTHA